MNKKILSRIFKRIIASLFMLFGLVTIIFFLIRIVPGDPTVQYYSPKLGIELAEKVKSDFGLDKSILVQYFLWLKNLLQGDLGFSIVYKRPVLQLLSRAIPITFTLASISLVLQMSIGIYLGLVTGTSIGSRKDKIISFFTFITYCTPTFFLAIFLIYFLSIQFNLFPTSHLHSIGYENFSMIDRVIDFAYHLILPVIVLTLSASAFTTRFMRDSVSDVMNQQFITSLRGLGIEEKKLISSHVLPNALLPVITILGIEIGSLLGGALITETIFSLPGIGRLAVESIFSRDYPLIIGCTIISGIMVIVGNFIADLITALLDPRISTEAIG